ncbi:FtsX-like permease family protein [Actinoplanes sp. NPDC024001]|uniref:FtsX-like permease family protein n=1 Tax=Actinoplanes sp. NPDC024001 TaxID=3154598 RepID=UPI0033EDE90D
MLILLGVFIPLVIRPVGEWILERSSGYTVSADWVMAGIALIVLTAIFGVVLGTGWVTYTAGRVLHRYGRRPGALLAGRQLMADPWSGSRLLAALLAAVVIGAGVQAYRSGLATQFVADEQVWQQLDGTYEQDTAFYFNAINLINVAVGVGLVLAAAGIMIALAEGIVTRRRTYSALVATGVPRRTLGEAIAWQTFAPLIPATTVALIVGTGLVRTVNSTVTARGGVCSGAECADEASASWRNASVTLDVPIPFAELVVLGAGAVVVMALVAGVGMLTLRSSTDLEELRVG